MTQCTHEYSGVITYQITQTFRSAYRNTSHEIYLTSNENYARKEFERLKRLLPDEYFELLMIEEKRTCLEYTATTCEWLTEKNVGEIEEMTAP